jgi:uncharacterized protein
MNRRQFLTRATVLAGTTVAFPAFGYDKNNLVVRRYDLPVPGLKKSLKALQISDFHFDRLGSFSEKLRSKLTQQIKDEQADLIFATGDFISQPGDPVNDALGWLGSLEAKEGIYTVMGNHDYTDERVTRKALKAHGLANLENKWTTVHGMALAGVGDLSLGPHEPKETLAKIPKGMGKILMAHQPDTFWYYDDPVNLQISGHTHGGQVNLFGFVPLLHYEPALRAWVQDVPGISRRLNRIRSYRVTGHGAWAGFYDRPDGSRLYVNSGLGRFKSLSFYCPPELTVFNLIPKEV